jgi:DUF2993 family protein
MTARAGRRAAVVVVVVVLVAGLGDHVVRAGAERRLSKQTTCRLDAVHSSVTIGGAFLAPQILRGRYTHITIDSQGVHEPGGPVDITADLHDVREVGHNRLSAGHGKVTVVVPFSTVATGAGKGYSASESEGELVFTPTSGPDESTGSIVFAKVALDGDDLVVTPVRVALAGQTVPWAKAERVAARDGQSLAPHRVQLPATLTSLGLNSATATPAGLLLEAAGRNLTLLLPDVPGCG